MMSLINKNLWGLTLCSVALSFLTMLSLFIELQLWNWNALFTEFENNGITYPEDQKKKKWLEEMTLRQTTNVYTQDYIWVSAQTAAEGFRFGTSFVCLPSICFRKYLLLKKDKYNSNEGGSSKTAFPLQKCISRWWCLTPTPFHPSVCSSYTRHIQDKREEILVWDRGLQRWDMK